MADLLVYGTNKVLPVPQPFTLHDRPDGASHLDVPRSRARPSVGNALLATASLGHRRRRNRTLFDDSAIKRLEGVFAVEQYPDIVLRELLADELRIPEARIQTWFQNKRSRTKRQLNKARRESAKASPDSDVTRVPSRDQEEDSDQANCALDYSLPAAPSAGDDDEQQQDAVKEKNRASVRGQKKTRPPPLQLMSPHPSDARRKLFNPSNPFSIDRLLSAEKSTPGVATHPAYNLRYLQPVFNPLDGRTYMQPVAYDSMNSPVPMFSPYLHSPLVAASVPSPFQAFSPVQGNAFGFPTPDARATFGMMHQSPQPLQTASSRTTSCFPYAIPSVHVTTPTSSTPSDDSSKDSPSSGYSSFSAGSPVNICD